MDRDGDAALQKPASRLLDEIARTAGKDPLDALMDLIHADMTTGMGIMGRLGRRVKNGVYGLGGVWLWNSDFSCNSSPSGYRPASRCT